MANTYVQYDTGTLSEHVHPFFNSKEANVVLCSAEGTFYRVPSFVLRSATEYFRAILPSTPPLGLPSGQEQIADPIIVDEKDVVLERFLRLISGLDTPVWESFDELDAVMSLADARGPMCLIRAAVTAPRFLAQPLRLYVMATRLGWEHEAKLASTHTLKLSIYDEEYAEQLQRLPAKHLMALLSLHRRRRDLFMTSLDTGEAFTAGNNTDRYCSGCGEKVDNHSWREFKARMFLEMDQRPLGDTLLSLDMEDWRESIACWSAKCRNGECRMPHYDRSATLRAIQDYLEEPPRPPTPEPTIAVYTRELSHRKSTDDWEEIQIRLVGTHPLWGNYLWNAARAFASYLDEYQELCRDKYILELGAGGALPSILAAKSGARKVVITDYPDDDLVDNIIHNVDANIPASERDRVSVQGYIWGRTVDPLLETISTTNAKSVFDLIILSDLIFNHSQHDALLTTCELAFRRNPSDSHSISPTASVFVFYSHHRPHLAHRDMEFFEKAWGRGWVCEEILTRKFPPMFPDDSGEESVRATVHGWRLTRSSPP
ncbi:hypothetical protein C0995_013679 [Termitomyces sp. Mi166|nr:hypothetical protein C0995_013679 [Termitomyces sp. Mi166\